MQGGGNSAYHQEHTPTHCHLYPSMRRPSLYLSRDDASALQSLPHSPTMHSAPRGEDAPVCNAPGGTRARAREKLSSTLLSQIMFSRCNYSPAHQHYRLTPKMLLTYHFMLNLSRSSFLHPEFSLCQEASMALGPQSPASSTTSVTLGGGSGLGTGLAVGAAGEFTHLALNTSLVRAMLSPHTVKNDVWVQWARTHERVCMRVCMYACIYACTHMHACIYAFIVCMHVFV
jgi:hypothetical protein